MKILTTNRKAYHDYFVIQSWEAGIILKGTEIKSLRETQADIAAAWVKVEKGEVYLVGATIQPYSQAKEAWQTHEPGRTRKLLLNRNEINRLERELGKGTTAIALDIHLNERNIAKVKIALVKGKKKHDKRQTIKDRDLRRYGE